MNAAIPVSAAAASGERFPSLAPVGVAAAAYASLVGAGFAAWHAFAGTEPAWLAALVSVLPALLCAALALTSQADRRQYCARLVAAALMAPVLALFWSIDGPVRWGPGAALAVAFVVVHVVGFLLGIRWLARFTTRIDPAPAVAPVPARTLARRILSIKALGLPVTIFADAPSRALQLRWHPTNQPGRVHVVRLDLHDDANAVTVVERETADGTAPVSEDEASMRSPGDDPFDPTRPDAQQVWMRTAQATMLDAQRLRAAPVALAGEHVQWVGSGPPRLPDTDALMACLAAIVLRSGWAWRPGLTSSAGG